MLSTVLASLLRPKKSDLSRPTEKTDRQRADAGYLSVIPYAALCLFIFCISEQACLLTTVVNIGRLIMSLSVHVVHSSVASC